jgi:hypothetical protein
MMAKQVRLPRLLSNSLVVLEIVEELREHADNVEKAAAESGRQQRERPRVLKIRGFASQLESVANARLGDQVDG